MKKYICDYLDIRQYIKKMFIGYKDRVNNSAGNALKTLESISDDVGNAAETIEKNNSKIKDQEIIADYERIKTSLQKVTLKIDSIIEAMQNELINMKINGYKGEIFLSRFMALYLEKDPLSKEFIAEIETRLGIEFEGLCDVTELVNKLSVVAEKIHSHEISGKQIEEEIDDIIMKDIDTEEYINIPLCTEINNRRIALIRTYLDSNRFFDMTEDYPSAEEVLKDSFAIELYNHIHKKEQKTT